MLFVATKSVNIYKIIYMLLWAMQHRTLTTTRILEILRIYIYFERSQCSVLGVSY